MPHPDNTTQQDTSHYSSDQYDSNDDEDYSNVDSEINEGVWRFMKTPHQANLTFHLNAVDNFLFNNFKEEIDVVTGRIFSKINTSSDIMNQIVNLFVDPLISRWLDAANASNHQDDVPLTDEDMRHFIKTLAYLSFYGKTPTVFFGNERAFPPASRLSLSSFRRVLKGLSKPSCDQLISMWEEPFKTCPNVQFCEKKCNEINSSLAYIDKISIISQDDDQYRLTSKLCEEIGLVRINNPKKAFGPVATGCVSLTSGITLSLHIANRGETALDITQILMMSLTKKLLPQKAIGSNIIAMDRGYWNHEMVKYLTSNGFQIIGTHKRTKTFPFTFGEITPTSNQKLIPTINTSTQSVEPSSMQTSSPNSKTLTSLLHFNFKQRQVLNL